MKLKLIISGLVLLISAFTYGEEIEILCNCVNDCVHPQKCNAAYEMYMEIRRSGNPYLSETENNFVIDHDVLLIDIVDWGKAQCATVFGFHNYANYRFDFEVQGNKISASKLEKVNSVPTLNERKTANSEDLCVFKL